MAIRLDNAKTYHPRLHFELPHDFLAAYGEEKCQPAVLVRLPPALFLDPNDFAAPSSSSLLQGQIASLRYLNSTHSSHHTYDFNKVDVEGGVGYSNPTTEQRDLYISQRGEITSKVGKAKGNKGNSYIVSSSTSTFTTLHDDNKDAKRPLARETRAVLISLVKENKGHSTRSASKEDDFDELTGLRSSSAEAITTLNVPLHARYVAPVVADITFKSILSGGYYEAVHLEKPDLILMCTRLSSDLPSDIYEQITAADLLPSPHSHLSLQLAPHQDQWSFHRFRLNAQHDPFQIDIPTGNTSLAAFVQLVTFASLVLAALCTATQTHNALSKMRQIQIHQKKTS